MQQLFCYINSTRKNQFLHNTLKNSSHNNKSGRRILWLICAGIGCLLLSGITISVLYIRYSAIPPENAPYPLFDVVTAQVQNGDLIFRKGYGFWAERFEKTSKRDQRYSHCGVLRPTSQGWVVIHAEADDITGRGEVFAEPIENFCKKSRYIGVYRLNLPPEARRYFSDAAQNQCGVPFDYLFDPEDHKKLYCTELLLVALQEAAPQLHFAREEYCGVKIIPLDAFYNPEVARCIFFQDAKEP